MKTLKIYTILVAMRTEGNLGAKVRVLRRSQRMTQVELARRLGISPSYLNLIEHNRRSFTADLLVKMPPWKWMVPLSGCQKMDSFNTQVSFNRCPVS